MDNKKPEWWPRNPYPENVFPMKTEEYVKAVPDPHLRAAISGCLGRHFWQLCEEEIWRRWCEFLDDNEENK